MAIPFNVETGETDEMLLQQLVGELCQKLRQIRLVQGPRIPLTTVDTQRAARVQPTIQISMTRTNFERGFHDIGVKVGLSQVGFQNNIEIVARQTATGIGENTLPIEPNAQPNQEASVSLLVEIKNREWPKQEQSETEDGCSGACNLLSKLGPICTAVICVVGWHLLRGR